MPEIVDRNAAARRLCQNVFDAKWDDEIGNNRAQGIG